MNGMTGHMQFGRKRNHRNLETFIETFELAPSNEFMILLRADQTFQYCFMWYSVNECSYLMNVSKTKYYDRRLNFYYDRSLQFC